MIGVGIAIVAAMLALEGFFAGVETAFVSCNRVRIEHLADKGRWRAKLVRKVLEHPETFLSTTLLGVNVSVVIGTVVTNGLVEDFSGKYAFVISTLIMWPLALLVGEILPKILFYYHADQAVILCILPLRFVSAVLFPLVFAFTQLGRFAARFVGGAGERGKGLSREELRILVQEGQDLPTVVPEMREMIERIFDFKSVTAGYAMVPLADVATASEEATVEEIHLLMEESGHSRIPLRSSDDGRIHLYVRAVDLVGRNDDLPVKILGHEPIHAETREPAYHLLREFQRTGCHVALVRDEKGADAGVLTLEDVLEEIVGEIEDEYVG